MCSYMWMCSLHALHTALGMYEIRTSSFSGPQLRRAGFSVQFRRLGVARCGGQDAAAGLQGWSSQSPGTLQQIIGPTLDAPITRSDASFLPNKVYTSPSRAAPSF